MSDRPEWTAPDGMEHRLCSHCKHWFASREVLIECPTCTVGTTKRDRRKRRESVSDPYGPGLPNFYGRRQA